MQSMHIISNFALFAILVSAVPAFSIDVSHSLSSRGTVGISRMEGFDFKTQGGNSIELATLLEWPSFAISGILGMHGAEATNLGGGWGYRGYEGAHARLQMEFPLFSGIPSAGGVSTEGIPAGDSMPEETESRERPRSGSGFVAGWGGGGGAFFSRYRETELLLFYPSAYTFLFFDWYTAFPRVRIRYTVPFEWYFRKDLAVSFSLGLSIGVVYTWTQPAGKGGK